MPLRSSQYLFNLCIASLLMLCSFVDAQAQAPRFRIFNESTGLNRHSIFDMEKDARGFYWLGTEKGLIRFDGANFIEVNPPAPYTFERVQELYRYKDYLYILYSRIGCVRLNLKDYTSTVITDISVSGIVQKNDNEVLFTGKNGNIYSYANDRTTLRYASQAPFSIHPMHIRDQVLLVHFFKKGLHAFDLNSYRLIKNLGGDTLQNQLTFLPINNDLLFIGNGSKFQITKELSLIKLPLTIKDQDISYLSFHPSGDQYYIDRRKQLFRTNATGTEVIPLPNLQNTELRKIIIHDENNLLITSNVGLLHLQTTSSPISLLSDNSIHSPTVLRIRRKIIPLSNDEYLLFGYSQNFRYKNGIFKPFDMPTASSYDAIKYRDDVYFTTEDKGIFKYHIPSEKVTNLNKLFQKDLPPAYAIQLNQEDSILLIGGRKRLLSASLKTHEVNQIPLPFAFDFIQSIEYDATYKRYWIGTDSGLVCLDKKFNHLKTIKRIAQQTKILDVTDVHIHSKSNLIWVAHRYGVEILSPEKFTVVKQLGEDFFENPVVAGLIEDQQGRVWMSTYEGISAYEPQLDARLHLGTKNNLTNTEFNITSYGIMPNGKLIFGGLTGYDIIDPSKFTFNRSTEKGLITGYERIFGDSSRFHSLDNKLSSIQFDIDKESIRIYLSAENDLNARIYRYEYRINNEGWISMKDASFLNIYKLDPGLYKLQFRGYDEYGTLITFKPLYINAIVVFYKNRYFIWSLFLFALSLVVFVVINELRRKKREDQLKEQISMDLHDEVGTILTRALMLSQTKSIPKKEEKIGDYLSEALFSLRVYINTMNKRSFSLYQLSDEMKELISKTFPETEYQVTLNTKIEIDVELSSEKYRDMKLCLFEIMNNILKHAHCKHISIDLHATPLLIRFHIKDDGVLTRVEELEEKGNGIRNIQKRVKKHKGISTFTIGEAGHGLEISLICPQ